MKRNDFKKRNHGIIVVIRIWTLFEFQTRYCNRHKKQGYRSYIPLLILAVIFKNSLIIACTGMLSQLWFYP